MDKIILGSKTITNGRETVETGAFYFEKTGWDVKNFVYRVQLRDPESLRITHETVGSIDAKTLAYLLVAFSNDRYDEEEFMKLKKMWQQVDKDRSDD